MKQPEEVNNKCDDTEDWCGLKRKLLDIVSEACGYTKGVDKDKNADVDVAVYRKKELFWI